MFPENPEVSAEQAELFQLVVENVKEYAIFVTDKEGTVVSWNPGVERLLGYTEEQIVGQPIAVIFTPEDRAAGAPEKEMATAARTGCAEDKRWHQRHDGTCFWANGMVIPLKNNDGTLRGFSKIMRDDTAQKLAEDALRRSEEKYRTLFETIDEGFCVFELIYDAQGEATDFRYVEVNGVFERQTGLRNVIGRLGSEVVPNTERHWFEAYDNVAKTGAAMRLENYNQATGRWYDAHASRVGDAGSRLICVIFDDITARKRAEMNQAFLEEIHAGFTNLNTADDIMQTIGAKVGTFMQVPYCHFMAIDEMLDEVEYLARWNAEEVAPLPDKVRLSEQITEDFRRLAYRGETVAVGDTGATAITNGAANAEINVAAFITVPFLKNDVWKYQFSVHDDKPRKWRTDEIELVQEIAAQIFPLFERTRAEEKLRSSEEKYRTLFNSIASGFCIIEMIYNEAGKPIDWLFLEANPAFERNNSIKDVAGKTITEMAPNIEPKWFEIYGRVARTGEPERFVEGSEALGIWFDVYAFRIGEPKERKLAVLFNDVTAQKAAEIERERLLRIVEAERSRLAYMFEQAPAFVTVLRGAEHRFETTNPAYQQLIGHRDVIGKTVREALPEIAGQGFYQLLDNVFQTGEPYIGREMKIDLQPIPGGVIESRILDFVYQPMFEADDAVSGIFVHGIDVTEQVEARQQAETANRIKDEFLATLSHELRTPLSSIIGWSKILLSGNLGAEQARKAVETIDRNAQAQKQLIEDILDVSRIISGKLRLDVRAVDLMEVITTAVETTRPGMEAKDIRIQTLLDPKAGTISGDPDRLQQVIWNLLSNALKFTEKGGRVQIRLERVNSSVEMSVSDTGKGIEPEFLPYVFDRFRQSDGSMTRRQGGLGLGLAIVRQIVELHGGTVAVKSEGNGEGATFIVSLPVLPVRQEPESEAARVHPAAEINQSTAEDNAQDLTGLQILIVDDEADSRTLLRTLLGLNGAEVTSAASAAEALEILNQQNFNVIVSDIGMPGEDGFSLIEKIRKLPAAQGGTTPAVALTAYARSEDRVRALRSGFQMHVAKPIEHAELLAVILNLTGRISS